MIKPAPLGALLLSSVLIAAVATGAGSRLTVGPLAAAPLARGEAVGVREPAWSPDGSRIAVAYLDRIWTMAPDGKQAKPLATAAAGVEREPAWSPDGRTIAFAADRGDGFDIYTAPSRGGVAVRLTAMAGDERWPSWAPASRLVFAHRAPLDRGAGDASGAQWDLYSVRPAGGEEYDQPPPVRLTDSSDVETEPRVSPDGARVVYVSDRDSDDGETDLWVMVLRNQDALTTANSGENSSSSPDSGPGLSSSQSQDDLTPLRVTSVRGIEGGASWAPAGDRVSYYAVRDGVISTWVSSVDPIASKRGEPVARPRPAAQPLLLSRHGGFTAWSPDGRTVLIAELPDPDLAYNGNPLRHEAEPPPMFGLGRAFKIWIVPAPAAVDEGGHSLEPDAAPHSERLVAAFDRVWETLRRLYYSSSPVAAEWDTLRARYRPMAQRATDEAALEAIVDKLVAEQPLIKPVVSSSKAVVVSAHPLASEAGRIALAKGGNVVDAAIAVSFALGVVEPDASGVGGDGMAVVYLKGMREPVVIDYKDQTPIHATLDNQRIFRQGRLVVDGPAAANIPGAVAGLDHLYRHYSSGKTAWADLVEPAIRYAEEGFVLDEALPTSIAEGRRFIEKYREARRIFLPEGQPPRPGDRFVNKDYGATLRIIAKSGADGFYRGELAKKIAADMAANGGIIGFEDLAQYRAIERRPVAGRYRGNVVYGAPPPVPSGVSLIEALQVLDNYKPAPGAGLASDPDYFHYLIESWKVRDQIRSIADPDRWPVNFADHLKPSHAADLFRKIDARKASRLSDPNEDEPALEESPRPPERIGRGTTGFAVADAEGNMIAVTQTLSTWGGNFYVSEGLGFLYNNHLRSIRTRAGAYGQLLPLVRSSSTSNPTLVFRERPAATDGRRLAETSSAPHPQETAELIPRLAVSVAGNAWITASVYSIIANVVDSGMAMQKAVEAPRFLVGRDPSDPLGTGARIQIEDRMLRATLDELMRRGHRFQKIGRKGEVRYGYASAVLIDAAAGRVEGGADPRRSHAAIAVDGASPTTAERR